MSISDSLIGKQLTCVITGKTFIGAASGVSTNYARDSKGLIYSDEGVDIAEKKDLLERKTSFSCYISSDGKTITGWKGNKLGTVTQESIGGGFGGTLTHIRVIDIHGGEWYGKGAGRGMCITLRPTKKLTNYRK